MIRRAVAAVRSGLAATARERSRAMAWVQLLMPPTSARDRRANHFIQDFIATRERKRRRKNPILNVTQHNFIGDISQGSSGHPLARHMIAHLRC